MLNAEKSSDELIKVKTNLNTISMRSLILLWLLLMLFPLRFGTTARLAQIIVSWSQWNDVGVDRLGQPVGRTIVQFLRGTKVIPEKKRKKYH